MARNLAATLIIAVLFGAPAPSGAQVFGALYVGVTGNRLPLMMSDKGLARWMMTLPAEDREPVVASALLDPNPVGGEARSLEPPATSEPVIETGRATWNRLQGRTASGEPADPNGFTAGHRTFPFGTRLRVTNPANGKSVVVRVNDRGPKTPGVLIDLSEASAKAIGMAGSAPVVLSKAPPAALLAESSAAAAPTEGRSAIPSRSAQARTTIKRMHQGRVRSRVTRAFRAGT